MRTIKLDDMEIQSTRRGTVIGGGGKMHTDRSGAHGDALARCDHQDLTVLGAADTQDTSPIRMTNTR